MMFIIGIIIRIGRFPCHITSAHVFSPAGVSQTLAVKSVFGNYSALRHAHCDLGRKDRAAAQALDLSASVATLT